jgi:hypothetical protein
MTQIPLYVMGADPDAYFTTDSDGNRHLIIPPGLGGRYELLARLDWTRELPYGGGHSPVWTLDNANSGMLYAYPALAGDPAYALPESRLTATPVAHAKHTWQHFHWQGILDQGDEIQFFVNQFVSDGETYQDGSGEVFDIVVQAIVTLDLRRPGIQY